MYKSIMMPYLGLFVFLMILPNCISSSTRLQGKSLLIKKATLQELYSGVRGGGKNIHYIFNLEVHTNKPIQFDSIWIADKRLAVRTDDKKFPVQINAAREDVVLNAFEHVSGLTERANDLQAPAPLTISVRPPITFNGAALIRYTVDGSTKYLIIPAFKILPPIYGQ